MAATWRTLLCPSFFRAEIVQNPGWWNRVVDRVRSTVIGP
jgi:indolepyruvate ferredoxin oxidoreductase, alpha subunit